MEQVVSILRVRPTVRSLNLADVTVKYPQVIMCLLSSLIDGLEEEHPPVITNLKTLDVSGNPMVYGGIELLAALARKGLTNELEQLVMRDMAMESHHWTGVLVKLRQVASEGKLPLLHRLEVNFAGAGQEELDYSRDVCTMITGICGQM